MEAMWVSFGIISAQNTCCLIGILRSTVFIKQLKFPRENCSLKFYQFVSYCLVCPAYIQTYLTNHYVCQCELFFLIYLIEVSIVITEFKCTYFALCKQCFFLPFSGNKYTLETKPSQEGIDVRQELLKFHSTYYSSNLMAICVLGRGKNPKIPFHRI